MKKTLLLASLLTIGSFSISSADEIQYQDPLVTTPVVVQTTSVSGTNFSNLATSTAQNPYWITQAAVWIQASSTGTAYLGFNCSLQVGGTVCPGWTVIGFSDAFKGLASIVPVQTTPGGALVNVSFNYASTTAFFDPQTQQLQLVFIKTNSTSTNFTVFGNTNTDRNCSGQCVFSGTSTPYLYIWGQETQPSQVASSSRVISQITPTNGATAPSTEVQFVFSWFNSGLEGYDISQTEINDITSGFQYTPIQSNAALSGTGQTTQVYNLTENHLHTWRACLLNSVTFEKTCSGFYSLNVVGPSASSSFPLLPEVTEGNASSTAQGGFFSFLNVPQLLQSKYPFSLFFDIADLYQSLQASSTEDVATVELDYSSLNLSSTTMAALPSSWVVFGTTTVTHFIPEAVLDAWRLLMTAVIWMGVIAYLYRAISKLFSGNTEHV